MSEQLTKYQKKLPSINELYSTDLAVLDKQNDLNLLLNQEPKKEWIKEHPIAKNVKYLPIERVEWLLTNIFVRWRVEILDTKLIANSVSVTIKLHYRNPITGEWDWMDGLGAMPLQTDKGSGATDWEHIKSDSVMKAIPAAESFAIKDAAEKLGKLFGKDLNRADKIGYDTLYAKFDTTEVDINTKKRELIDLIDKQPKEAQTLLKRELRGYENEGLTLEILNRMIEKLK